MYFWDDDLALETHNRLAVDVFMKFCNALMCTVLCVTEKPMIRTVVTLQHESNATKFNNSLLETLLKVYYY